MSSNSIKPIFSLLLLITTLTACSYVPHTEKLLYINKPDVITDSNDDSVKNTIIRVMSLNLAHARRASFHQLFLGGNRVKENLNAIVALIDTEKPHVVALQEADGSSFWNGSFNHVEYLLKGSTLGYSLQGYHVKGMGLEYGTAILSESELTNRASYKLERATLTLPKGLVISTIKWPNRPAIEVDIISLHLDFLSEKTRIRQAKKVIELLKIRHRPMIIMGDFNTDWNAKDAVLKDFAKELDLITYQAENSKLITFPYSKRRFDWILVSDSFEFVSFSVLSDKVSDHRAIVAEIGLRLSGKHSAAE
jgi:endonuclease/exonuclease/phosphatase family metal-dependent hydrolase